MIPPTCTRLNNSHTYVRGQVYFGYLFLLHRSWIAFWRIRALYNCNENLCKYIDVLAFLFGKLLLTFPLLRGLSVSVHFGDSSTDLGGEAIEVLVLWQLWKANDNPCIINYFNETSLTISIPHRVPLALCYSLLRNYLFALHFRIPIHPHPCLVPLRYSMTFSSFPVTELLLLRS